MDLNMARVPFSSCVTVRLDARATTLARFVERVVNMAAADVSGANAVKVRRSESVSEVAEFRLKR
jgi:hypothetical protein